MTLYSDYRKNSGKAVTLETITKKKSGHKILIFKKYNLRVYYKVHNISFPLPVIQDNKAKSPGWSWGLKARLKRKPVTVPSWWVP